MINANEQRVISAASGTFEYEGKTYRAKASYVSQLTAKLDKEGVDLTSADANAAISQIMANVGTGVKQGYLEEVGTTGKSGKSGKSAGGSKGSSKSGAKDASETGAAGGDAEKTENAEDSENAEKTENAENSENAGGGGEEGTAADAAAGKSGSGENAGNASDSIGRETPDGTEAGGTGGAGTEENTVPSVVQIYPEEAEKVESVQKFTDNAAIAKQTGRAFGQYIAAAAVIWALFILGTAVYLKKIKRRKRMMGGMAGIVLVSAAVIAVGAGYLFGREIYAADRWGQTVTESAYLKASYDDVAAVMQECLARAGLPKGTLESCIDENAVYRDAKALASGGGDAEEPVLEKRNLEIREAVAAAAPDVPEEQRAKMAQVLAQKYKERLEIPWQAYLEENREAGRNRLRICFLAGGAALAAGILVLKLRTRYLHRAVRGLYLGCLAGGAGFMLSGAFCRLAGPPLVIEPENYRRLLENYVQSVCQSGAYFGILTICVGLVFAIASYFMKTRIE